MERVCPTRNDPGSPCLMDNTMWYYLIALNVVQRWIIDCRNTINRLLFIMLCISDLRSDLWLEKVEDLLCRILLEIIVNTDITFANIRNE